MAETASSIRVLLLTDDPSRKRRWWDGLEHQGFLPAEKGDSDCADVVITDRPLNDDELATVRHQSGDEVGLISVVPIDQADVILPEEFTDRELRRSCQLLAEIVHLRRERNAFEKLAFTDPLTELPNRRAWDRDVGERFEIAQRDGQAFCLAMLDLDNFKQLNDHLGHLAGDEVLRRAGRQLSEHLVPEREYVARLGGDEFGYVVCGLQVEDAQERIEQARIRLKYEPHEPSANYGTTSAGLACWHDCWGKNWQDLFQAADYALRQAKSGGRNRMMLATPTP